MIPHRGWLFGGVAAVLLALSGCGSEKQGTTGVGIAKGLITQAIAARKGAEPAPPVTREVLSQFKTPMIQTDIPALGDTIYLVPYGKNGGVDTWSGGDDRNISFRDGVMIATRGFGPDIMQSVAPSINQIASGDGSYDRAYYYLDGADRTQRFDYRCNLRVAGTETITVVDRQHTTRHVVEECSGKTGVFANEYWFENGVFLRKSKQLLFVEWPPITFQRVIDNG